MAKLVNIFADETVMQMAMGMVHESEKERARTERRIRAHLVLIRAEDDLARRRKLLHK